MKEDLRYVRLQYSWLKWCCKERVDAVEHVLYGRTRMYVNPMRPVVLHEDLPRVHLHAWQVGPCLADRVSERVRAVSAHG